jgi:hypothetical protein
MKYRTVIIPAVTAATTVLAVSLWRAHRVPPAVAVTQGEPERTNGTAIHRAAREAKDSDWAKNRSPHPGPGDTAYLDYFAQMVQKDPHFEWKRPIDFYGRVLDERGAPVEGAIAKCEWNDLSAKGTSTAEVASDRNGEFVLARRRGKGLTVKVEKPGYYTQWVGTRINFEYANPHDRNFHIPDPKSPVVFRLRRRGQAEPLRLVEGTYSLPRDGTPVNVELVKGSVCPPETAHLRVECWNSAVDREVSRPYDWRARISAPGGGLIVHRDEFPFEAPTEVYVESDEIDMPRSLGREWRSQVDREYYVRIRDGRYARMGLRLIVGGNHYFRLVSYLNASGSRNLEYDPKARPPPGRD